MTKVTHEFEATLQEHKVECIRCGSHTINLVVNDVTSASEHNDGALKHVVKNSKAYRRAEYKQAFKLTKTPLPPIPNKTRWNSHYSMVSVLIKNREFYSNLGSQYNELGKSLFSIHVFGICYKFTYLIDLTDYWAFIEEYREAFQPLHDASLKSQLMECPVSQFHLEWLKAYGKIKCLPANRFRDNIIQSMENRQRTLMNNVAYKATLFFDPRFNYNGSELFKPQEKAEIVVSIYRLTNFTWKFKCKCNFVKIKKFNIPTRTAIRKSIIEIKKK